MHVASKELYVILDEILFQEELNGKFWLLVAVVVN